MKAHVASKQFSLFSICAYYGFACLLLVLFGDMFDDFVSIDSQLITLPAIAIGWLLVVAASLLYPVFHARDMKWRSLLPLGINLVILLCTYAMSASLLSHQLGTTSQFAQSVEQVRPRAHAR